MFKGVIEWMAEYLEMDGVDIQKYRRHLEAIRASFTDERSRALYAVFADGRRQSPRCAHEDDINIDVWIPNLMAIIVRINLEAGKSFQEVDGIVRRILNSSKMLGDEWRKGV